MILLHEPWSLAEPICAQSCWQAHHLQSSCFTLKSANRPDAHLHILCRLPQAHRYHQRVSVTGTEQAAAVTPKSLVAGWQTPEHESSVAARTVSVQAAAMLLDRAQSPGSHGTTTSIAAPRSDGDGLRPETAAVTQHHGMEPWPLSAAVAAWLDGVSGAAAKTETDAGESDSSVTGALSASDHDGPATADSISSGPPVLSCNMAERLNAARHQGSLQSVTAASEGADAAQPSKMSHGADTVLVIAAPRATADAEHVSALRVGPWHVSAGGPAEEARAGPADSERSRICAERAGSLVAAAQAAPYGASADPAATAHQALREQSAQTTVHIAPPCCGSAAGSGGLHFTDLSGRSRAGRVNGGLSRTPVAHARLAESSKCHAAQAVARTRPSYGGYKPHHCAATCGAEAAQAIIGSVFGCAARLAVRPQATAVGPRHLPRRATPVGADRSGGAFPHSAALEHRPANPAT